MAKKIRRQKISRSIGKTKIGELRKIDRQIGYVYKDAIKITADIAVKKMIKHDAKITANISRKLIQSTKDKDTKKMLHYQRRLDKRADLLYMYNTSFKRVLEDKPNTGWKSTRPGNKFKKNKPPVDIIGRNVTHIKSIPEVYNMYKTFNTIVMGNQDLKQGFMDYINNILSEYTSEIIELLKYYKIDIEEYIYMYSVAKPTKESMDAERRRRDDLMRKGVEFARKNWR